MATKNFKVISSAVVGIIFTLVVLWYTSTQTTWGRASEDGIFFFYGCGCVLITGFMFFYSLQDLWERFNPEQYKNFTEKITSSFCKFTDEITRSDD